jgi:hypothetical protein
VPAVKLNVYGELPGSGICPQVTAVPLTVTERDRPDGTLCGDPRRRARDLLGTRSEICERAFRYRPAGEGGLVHLLLVLAVLAIRIGVSRGRRIAWCGMPAHLTRW